MILFYARMRYMCIKYKWLQTLYSIDEQLVHNDFDLPANAYRTNRILSEAIENSTSDLEIRATVSDSYLVFEPYAVVFDSRCHCDSVALSIDRMMALMIQLLIDFVECDKMIEFDCESAIGRAVASECCLVMSSTAMSMWHLERLLNIL